MPHGGGGGGGGGGVGLIIDRCIIQVILHLT